MGRVPPESAVRAVARRYVAKHDLAPPVDPRLLLEQIHGAEVYREAWPLEEVDAILTGFDENPAVYYRATDNALRERFTLAHELGHLVIPWHTPNSSCASGDGEPDSTPRTNESEADLFASCLLVPDLWLQELLNRHGVDMSAILQELDTVEVTTIAALRGLRRMLLPGWVFVAYQGDVWIASAGTSLGPAELRTPGLEWLRAECRQSGSATINAYPIEWFRMHEDALLPPFDEDARTNRELLLQAISVVTASITEQRHLEQVANGVVGAMKNKTSGRPAGQAYSALLYKIGEHEELQALLDVDSFKTWVARRSREICST